MNAGTICAGAVNKFSRYILVGQDVLLAIDTLRSVKMSDINLDNVVTSVDHIFVLGQCCYDNNSYAPLFRSLLVYLLC
jgi:hypothetical protein